MTNSTCARIARASRGAVLTVMSVAALSVFTASVHADGIPARKRVDYADLNLSTQRDVNKLYARLRKAAEQVCGPFEYRELRRVKIQRGCYQQALAKAVAEVNHVAITELHLADKDAHLAQRDSERPPRS